MMAREAGISASAVRRIWKAHGLEPHRCRQFKLSNDPGVSDNLCKRRLGSLIVVSAS
jgi:hypothetical protein